MLPSQGVCIQYFGAVRFCWAPSWSSLSCLFFSHKIELQFRPDSNPDLIKTNPQLPET